MSFDFSTLEKRHSFYESIEWKRLREFTLSKEPFCRQCKIRGNLKAATLVHHIEDLKDSPELCLEMSNMEPLCRDCHSSITLKKQHEDKKPKKDKRIKIMLKKWIMK